jgi:transcriptional regulator with GAF, ATPase, and Fis domain
VLHSTEKVSNADTHPLVSMAEMERNYIISVLENTHWLISGEQGAATILQMHPNTLRSRMSKLGIRPLIFDRNIYI